MILSVCISKMSSSKGKPNTPSSIVLQRPLGSGAFGRVYEGSFTDPRDGTTYEKVAIKYINLRDFPPAIIKAHRQETQLSQSIESDAIAKVIAEVDNGDDLFIIMERLYDDITALQEDIEQARHEGEWDEVAEKMIKHTIHLANGLRDIHAACILHRDIKPENILMDKKTRMYKYCDFGMSCFYQSCEGVVGTPSYMEPACYFANKFGKTPLVVRNQQLPCNITEWSDVFSLGMTLYEILTGKKLLEDVHSANAYYESFDDAIQTLDQYSRRGGDMKRYVTCLKRMIDLDPSQRPSPKQITLYLSGHDKAFETSRKYIYCPK